MKDIQKFMEKFLNTSNGQLKLNGKTYPKSDCILIAKGSKKLAYKIKGTNLCFFLPRKALYKSRERFIDAGKKALYQPWDMLIRAEKRDLDFIINLGLKAQRYDLVPIEIQEEGDKNSFSMNVLVAQNFHSLCEQESLVIHNFKAATVREHEHAEIIGSIPDIASLRKRLSDKSFARTMLRQVVQDYVLASTYDLPINVLRWLNYESQQLCFEFAANQPPSVRYMFWDVVHDFNASGCPWVPTLKDLKSGGDYRSNSIQSLKYLALEIASAIMDLSDKNGKDKMDTSYEALMELQRELLTAINDDAMLNQALAHARKIGLVSFNKILDIFSQRSAEMSQKHFIDAIQIAITLESLDGVKRLLAISPRNCLSKLSKENMNELTKLAAGYPNSTSIIDHLNVVWEDNSEEGKLTSQFHKAYDPKLEADKGFILRFFAVSHVSKDMSLQELVRHAQGLSGKGSGKRSQDVMRTMGWLDENNEVTEAISCYIQ